MTDELLNALKTIKDECSKHKLKCNSCPLITGEGGCGVTNVDECPSDWKLQKREVYF